VCSRCAPDLLHRDLPCIVCNGLHAGGLSTRAQEEPSQREGQGSSPLSSTHVMSRDIVQIGVETSFIKDVDLLALGGFLRARMLCRRSPQSSLIAICRSHGTLTAAPRRRDWQRWRNPPSEPPLLSLEMIPVNEPTSYERCLDSSMNDVLNHDTLSSTHISKVGLTRWPRRSQRQPDVGGELMPRYQ
jgi:hypothetical protein